MVEKQPNPEILLKRIDLTIPLIGFYDAPDPTSFKPLVEPRDGECTFLYFKDWMEGKTLHLTKEKSGCRGAGRHMFGVEFGPMDEFLKFLVDGEGLKANTELMKKWIESRSTYKCKHDHILIGPLKEDMWEFARSVVFYVNPDQLSMLMIGAEYSNSPDDPPAVIAPFGSGCMQLLPFKNLDIPQASIGNTDIAMREHLPANILALTVTRSMFKQLCELDEKSFLYKPFLGRLRKSRGLPNLD
jgi:hypothetical protein